MSNDKQIEEKAVEEMAKALNEATFGVNTHTLADHLKPETINKVAEYLYNAGYRKQSEGEWLEIDDGVLIGDGKHLECSECGVWKKDRQRSNFCSNCGAKMKGGAE